MQKNLALCLITSRADEEKARALGESLRPHVDEVVITVADTDEHADFKWIDDFSAARNFNFAQTKADWILWLDADDTLEHPENLKELIKIAEERNISGFWFKYKYAFDENGNCVDEHWKAQLLKNDGHFEWKGAIHEDPIQLRPVTWTMTDKCVRVHCTTKERAEESYARNLRILLAEREKHPEEARTMFYLGRTYVAAKQYDKAIEVLQTYLEYSGWDDERYEARLLIGQCYVALDDIDTAIIVYNDALLEKESNPDAYIYKGMCYLRKGEWNKSLYNFKIALELPIPDAVTYFNPMFYRRDVYASIALAYLNLGKLEDAKTAIAIAAKVDSKSENVKQIAGMVYEVKDKHDTAKKIVEVAKFLDKHDKLKIPILLQAVPQQLLDNELLIALRRKFIQPKKWPEKSIAVFCGTSAEDWSPESLNKGGIGGSETAVIELTKRFVKHGWKVTVFNQGGHPPEGRTFDGVEYQNFWTFNVEDDFDVVWVWRTPAFFDYDVKARLKILDLHDVMNPLEFTKERLARMDKIFVKTQYHRSLLPDIPDDKFVIVGNGIDLDRFKGKQEKDPYRFCYTSSPNRGLDLLLKMWPKIKSALPEATLHVYYGWKTYYELEKHNPERIMWMKKVQEQMNQDGVVDHGRVGQQELAQDLLKTAFWLYPTYFPEIDCITAKEMQAAGVVPITSGFAALEESQQSGVKLKGDVYDPAWQEQYVTAVINQATNAQKENRDLGYRTARKYSWDSIADRWNQEIA